MIHYSHDNDNDASNVHSLKIYSRSENVIIQWQLNMGFVNVMGNEFK